MDVMWKKNVYGVGMIRINSRVKAAGIIQIILEKLEQFELDMKTDIMALSAFVMRKNGRLLGIEHQLCYNHGIHLAVVDFTRRYKLNLDVMDAISKKDHVDSPFY
ncbi:hypothetical protein T09_8803 [Trichinella sp. T9]|nr:hypothetical protein T09_8803 [Trichinella sp. T9]